MSRSEQGRALSVLGLGSASGAAASIFAKDSGVTASALWILVSLVTALIGILYSRRSERRDRVEALELEIRTRKKVEAAIAEEERTEEGKRAAEKLRLVLSWLSCSNESGAHLSSQSDARSPQSPNRDP
jgi:hypothetical protein